MVQALADVFREEPRDEVSVGWRSCAHVFMSEYQHYEFQAIDRPLTKAEMQELRRCFRRATIMPTSFVNHYEWGNFKGDVDLWMEKYFDAFLSFANWGTRTLKFRLAKGLLDKETVRAYRDADVVSQRRKSGFVVLTFHCDDESGESDNSELDEEEVLASLTPVRAELARGDIRALYLGWLAAAQSGVLDDGAVEPPVPNGLGQLSAALEALVAFLRIDSALIQAAARASAPRNERPLSRKEIAAWLSALPTTEKDELLIRLIVAPDDRALPAELSRRGPRALGNPQRGAARPVERRTVAALLGAAGRQP